MEQHSTEVTTFGTNSTNISANCRKQNHLKSEVSTTGGFFGCVMTEKDSLSSATVIEKEKN